MQDADKKVYFMSNKLHTLRRGKCQPTAAAPSVLPLGACNFCLPPSEGSFSRRKKSLEGSARRKVVCDRRRKNCAILEMLTALGRTVVGSCYVKSKIFQNM